MTVKLRGREGKEMHGGENEEMQEKRNRGQGVKVRGRPFATTTGRPRGGAKGLFVRCQGSAVDSVWAASK